MKTITLLLVSAFCLTLIGCGRIYGPVEEARALADEKEEVLTQMSKTIETNPTEAGVAEARKIFEAHKGSLKTKRDAIKAAPQGMNSDWSTFLSKTEARHDEMLAAMNTKFSVACWQVECSPAKAKLSALEKDFKETVNRY
jgi:hypothetical protein